MRLHRGCHCSSTSCWRICRLWLYILLIQLPPILLRLRILLLRLLRIFLRG